MQPLSERIGSRRRGGAKAKKKGRGVFKRPQTSSEARSEGLARRPNQRAQNQQLKQLRMFPGLQERVTAEALELRVGEGLLGYLPDSENYLEGLDADTESHKVTMRAHAPWLQNKKGFCAYLKQNNLPLHLAREIVEFARYFSASPEEIADREDALRRLRSLAQSTWGPDCKLGVFGSYATGVYLPNADIDVALFAAPLRTSRLRGEMYRFARRLEAARVGRSIEVVSHARVPIIKYVDSRTDIAIDISFEQPSGLVNAQTVRKWIAEEPALKMMVMVVRQFLRVHNLHEVVRGGLGGFSTICLVHSFLRRHYRFGTQPQAAVRNVGLLLLQFFEYYGKQFDNTHYAVVCTGDCTPRRVPAVPNQGIHIVDPSIPDNNISKGSFNYASVKMCFARAAELLRVECVTWSKTSKEERFQKSFLVPLLMVEKDAIPVREKRPHSAVFASAP